MKIVNDSIKQALKKSTTQRKGRILVNEEFYEVYNVEYYADSYEDGNVIGNAIASQLDFDLPYMEKFDSFKYFDGIWTGNEYEYIDMGTFNVFDEQDKDEFTKHITSFDNLIKFNVPMQDDGNYPKTLFQELQNICNQAGIELENTSIANGDFIIENNQFVGGENLKSVLKAICGVSGNYAIIKNDKLKLQLFNKTDEVITRAEHKPMDWKRKTYGINQVILGMSDVTGEYVIKQDDEDIEQNGVHKLVINDNFFAYTQEKREALIDELFEKVKGFGYIPYEMQNEWLSYLEIGDTLTIDDNETIVLRINGKSPNAIESSMSAPAIIDSAVEFVDNTETIKKLQRRTEIIVDKNSGNITNLTNNFTSIQDNLNNNYYTIEQSNQLIQNAETGVTNTFSEAGGNNIFRNTGLWFESEENLVKEDEFENNEIIIQNGLEKPIEELKIYGKSEQETRSGKNLFNKYGDFTYGNTNYKTSLNDKEQIVSTSNYYVQRSAGILIENLQPNTDYTISGVLVSANGTYKNNANIDIRGVSGTTQNALKVVSFASTLTKPYSFEETFNTGEYTSIWVSFNGHNADTTATTETIFDNIQIEQGQIKTEYEPYGVSPSPDYPSEIKSISGIENLFDKDNYLTIDGFINASTYKIQASTNSQKSTYVKVKPNTQYYISDFVFKSAIVVGSFTDVPKVGDVATNYVIKNASTTDLTITTGANDNYLVFMISNASSTTDTSKMQISSGSKKKPYVPYGRYLRIDNVGKNLLGLKDKSTTSYGLTYSILDNEITINGTATASDRLVLDELINPIKFDNSTKYRISIVSSGSVSKTNWSIQIRTSNSNIFTAEYDGLMKTSYRILDKNDIATHLGLYIGSGTTFTNFKIKVQVEKGETATEYESYRNDVTYVNLGDKKLCSIGDIEDEYEVVSGKGIKRINEVVLNGSENWVLNTSASNSNGYYEFQLKINDKPNEQVGLLCNRFQVGTSYDNSEEQIRNRTDYDIYINILGSRLESQDVTGFKKWLSNNPLTVQYILATPEEFTLEPKQINTRYGYNNIKLIEDIITNISIKFQQGGNYEFWNGTVLKAKNDKSSNSTALLLQDGILTQEQIVANGNYTVSFKYKKLIELAECKVRINDAEYILDSLEDKEFITGTKNEDGEFIIQPLKIDSGHINIQFITDTNNSCEIYDLMVNAGSVKLAYSQNQNETTTDTVNISKGITITSTNTDTTFRANADGIRTFDKNDNILTEFTDTGMITKKQVVEDEAQIVGVLVQRVGNQTWFTKI